MCTGTDIFNCLQIFLHFELVNSGFPAFLHSQCFRGISKRPIQILSPNAYQSCVFCLKHIFYFCVMSEDFSVSNVFMCVCERAIEEKVGGDRNCVIYNI